MTNFLCFVIALHVVSFANLYVIKNLNLNLEMPDYLYETDIYNHSIHFQYQQQKKKRKKKETYNIIMTIF